MQVLGTKTAVSSRDAPWAVGNQRRVLCDLFCSTVYVGFVSGPVPSDGRFVVLVASSDFG